MENLRCQSPSLNFFTTDQLVTLSQDLAKLINGQNTLTTMSVMMLRLIGSELTDQELMRFVRRYFHDASEHLADIQDDQMSVGTNSGDMSDLDEDEPDLFAHFKEYAIFQEIRSNFDEVIVLAAFIYNEGSANKEDFCDILTSWCMEHEDNTQSCKAILDHYKAANSAKPKQMVVEAEDPPETMEVVNSDDDEKLQSIADIFNSDGFSSQALSKKLELVWSNFLNFVNKLKSEDFVSFKVVARILEELRNDHEIKPNRVMIDTLHQGRPNLIICPEKEVHSTCLSIYAVGETENGQQKMLPRTDEVLLCTPETSLEALELVCRRAFHDQGGKIYCILHAENIDYDKSVRIEKIIADSTVSNHKYRLVFITSKEHNDRSYITTALDRFKRPVPDFMSRQKLQRFVLERLKIPPQGMDPDHCRGRLIVSEKAGNGKSLVVKNLTKTPDKRPVATTQIHSTNIDYCKIINRLLLQSAKDLKPKAYHFDLASQATKGKDDLIFALIVLGGLTNPANGQLWLCRPTDYHIVELTLPQVSAAAAQHHDKSKRKAILLLDILPKINCLSPNECLDVLQKDANASGLFPLTNHPGCWNMGFDLNMFKTSQYQRPFKHLFNVSLVY